MVLSVSYGIIPEVLRTGPVLHIVSVLRVRVVDVSLCMRTQRDETLESGLARRLIAILETKPFEHRLCGTYSNG